ncbi:N-alpha-acetyltransferase 30-like [Lingula anatina]|uniref:N-terminal methionine N(alpha)-acetyltransferase NatC n=1 Tax=Lingula anatina TaxID=7574 RepID=A0A1S3HJ17_LINAN|nr:N-alpha-acetyltransferase 30-like [Lingula anatina]XP_013395634.1 N-alpha-acetyltransferase 30-like [Lingula anatina]|eukprot:XP_013384989.1 N-alpha-acetyltransferase 30-like [Lingula anatina]
MDSPTEGSLVLGTTKKHCTLSKEEAEYSGHLPGKTKENSGLNGYIKHSSDMPLHSEPAARNGTEDISDISTGPHTCISCGAGTEDSPDVEKLSKSEGHSCSGEHSIQCSCTDVSQHLQRLSIGGLPTHQSANTGNQVIEGIHYVIYESELQMPDIMRLITKDLSEPYSIYTYRYFIHNWPKLCFLALDEGKCIGAIVCKLDMHKKMVRRGYIAMLAVDQEYRRKKIGSNLVLKAIHAMMADDCDEVVLETEITNKAALRLYENLGFVRDKRLFRYYLNGVDALRLKLWLR